MKKLLSIALVLVLMLSLGATAFAATDTTGWTSEATTFTLKKTYTGTTFPKETVKFTATAVSDPANPDTTAITVTDYTAAAATGNVTVNIPAYTKVGLYHYTITETAGDTQGVTYATNEIGISVLVEYDYTNNCLKATAGITKDAQGQKKDTFENTYDVGTLTVAKTVTGNLGDKNESFTVEVTLTATGKVYSDITVSGGSAESNAQTVAGNGWTGEKVVTITVKDGDTVTFSNIPANVTYVVAETDGTTKGYTVSYGNESGTIAKDTTSAATITNDKSTEIDTGISLDSLPYIVIAVLVVAGLAVMVVRKRRTNED